MNITTQEYFQGQLLIAFYLKFIFWFVKHFWVNLWCRLQLIMYTQSSSLKSYAHKEKGSLKCITFCCECVIATCHYYHHHHQLKQRVCKLDGNSWPYYFLHLFFLFRLLHLFVLTVRVCVCVCVLIEWVSSEHKCSMPIVLVTL